MNDYNEVCEVYEQARECNVCLPCFCAEDPETIEALLLAICELGREIGVSDLPVIIAWTSRYPGRGQMEYMTDCGDVALGTRIMFSLLREFTSPDSPYGKVRVLPHLDHAFPWLDHDALYNHIDDFASVMFDASEKPYAENIAMTAEYVSEVKGRLVVEGAADEVFESGGTEMKNELTTVEQAREFKCATGVDLVVPNLGTEHRATEGKVEYARAQAVRLREAIGSVMVLHGTSSLQMEDLGTLAEDGIMKVNVFTALAKAGGQAVSHQMFNDVGNIFSESNLQELVTAGVLGERYTYPDYREKFCEGKISPKLTQLCGPPRRHAWIQAVKKTAGIYLDALNYRNYGA